MCDGKQVAKPKPSWIKPKGCEKVTREGVEHRALKLTPVKILTAVDAGEIQTIRLAKFRVFKLNMRAYNTSILEYAG